MRELMLNLREFFLGCKDMSENTFESIEQRVSYGVGRQLGDQLRNNPFKEFDVTAVQAGLADAIAGIESQVSHEALNEAFAVVSQKLQEQEQAIAKEKAAEGEAFLAENAKRDEVTVTESGLQYEVLTTGEGEKPSASSTVRTHYHGTFTNGDVFDSSYDRGQPAEFPVNGVIAGWTEALQMMTEGSKWRLYIPYNLAYGEQGSQGAIPPYATLVFDVELLAVVS
ncbi:FKBP-type peptidyl-prolyl cis-trans isomerase FklB [Thalassotalea agarivorans]|uniref:Peptidyl-prolyl cis-trans isomerase n=2 Tax=Thalassotalea agarivorans TaxID=349064 RepID=A0A1I0FJF0_THASX|nr:FKBP-type peptidyl-prolyl cis-trans isomerase FklB [Thalassotalea agarivorans]